MNVFMWALGVLYWIALYVGNVWLCYTIAEQKNRNEVGWGWLAVFFGIPATLAVIAIRPLKTTSLNRAYAAAAREREERKKETKDWKSPDVGYSHPKK